jgi:hypothetical protein
MKHFQGVIIDKKIDPLLEIIKEHKEGVQYKKPQHALYYTLCGLTLTYDDRFTMTGIASDVECENCKRILHER